MWNLTGCNQDRHCGEERGEFPPSKVWKWLRFAQFRTCLRIYIGKEINLKRLKTYHVYFSSRHIANFCQSANLEFAILGLSSWQSKYSKQKYLIWMQLNCPMVRKSFKISKSKFYKKTSSLPKKICENLQISINIEQLINNLTDSTITR